MSKKLKLSQWHDESVKPVHVGVYEVRNDYNDYCKWSYFDGYLFNGCWESVCVALLKQNFGTGLVVEKWRGVLK